MNTMRVGEFVEFQEELLLAPDTVIKKDYMRRAITLIKRNQKALREIASVGILTPEEDTQRTARMRAIAQKELDREV